MSQRHLALAVAIALLGSACARQTPVEPTSPASISPTAIEPIRVGDVGGASDISALLLPGDIPGRAFYIEGANGTAIGGGELPSGIGPSALLQVTRTPGAGEPPPGCYTWSKNAPGGAHACTVDRSAGQFEGARSLAGFTSPKDGLLDFFIDTYPPYRFVILPGNKVPFLEVQIHAVFGAPRLGNQNFLVDGVALVDQTFLVPKEPFPQYCQNPTWPLNYVGLLSFIQFHGELPMFGKSRGVVEMCVLYQINPPG